MAFTKKEGGKEKRNIGKEGRKNRRANKGENRIVNTELKLKCEKSVLSENVYQLLLSFSQFLKRTLGLVYVMSGRFALRVQLNY